MPGPKGGEAFCLPPANAGVVLLNRERAIGPTAGAGVDGVSSESVSVMSVIVSHDLWFVKGDVAEFDDGFEMQAVQKVRRIAGAAEELAAVGDVAVC